MQERAGLGGGVGEESHGSRGCFWRDRSKQVAAASREERRNIGLYLSGLAYMQAMTNDRRCWTSWQGASQGQVHARAGDRGACNVDSCTLKQDAVRVFGRQRLDMWTSITTIPR